MSCKNPCLHRSKCPLCYINKNCETNINITKFSLIFAIHWDIRQTQIDSNFNLPKFIYTFTIAFMLLMSLINNICCLQTFLLHDIRSTNCGIFLIVYCCTGLITIICMQLQLLIMLEFDKLIQNYSYSLISCNIIPVIVILMSDICMWLTTLLTIEFVLLECFNLNLYRSRWFSFISSIFIFLLVIITDFYEIIAQHSLIDENESNFHTCTFTYLLPLEIINKILHICHIIIPCLIQFIASICILISISRRIIYIRDDYDHSQIYRDECIKRKHYFIPSAFIILSNIPQLILHLNDICENTRNILLLRMYIAFHILVYLPPSITFFIYIYPSRSYMRQFKQNTFIGQWLKTIFGTTNKVICGIPNLEHIQLKQ